MNKLPYTISILDEEDQERDSFFNYFEHFGFNCFEGLHCQATAEELIDTIRSENIDAIAIDYKLMEHGDFYKQNGDYFFKELNETLFNFPSFIITNDPADAKRKSSKINPFFILDKKRMKLEESGLADEIKTIIKNYKDEIEQLTEELKNLEEKRIKKKLLPNQEHRYIEINDILGKTVNNNNLLSKTFYSNDTNDRLDILIEKTEDLLNKISNENV